MRQIRKRLAWIFLAGGLYFVSKGAYVVYPLILPPTLDAAGLSDTWAAMRESRGAVSLRDGASGSPNTFDEGAYLGELEIPRLHSTIRVVEGVTDGALRLGAGHFPGTPLPGEGSNSVIAGHRDTYFRVLHNIRVGDRLVVKREAKDVAYTVSETRIVEPENVSVLQPGDDQILTLITCYPFQFIGAAPKRFIVKAIAEQPR